MQTSKVGTQPPAGDQLTGWIEAGVYVVVIALLSIAYATAIVFGAHAVVFIVYSMLIAALGMLAIAGVGTEPIAIMLAPQSWVVGMSSIILEGTYCLMLITISPAEGNLLVRLSVPLAVLAAWLIFKRVPTRGTLIGAAIVFSGVSMLALVLDPATQWNGIIYGIIVALAVGVRGFSTEFHPWNRAAKTVIDKMRVTALVILITGLAFLALAVLAASLVGAGVLVRNELFPAPADLWHWPTFAFALLVGGALFTAMNYLQFSSVVKIGTEHFISTSAFMPLATLIAQTFAAWVGLITVGPFDWRLLPGMLLAVVGVFVMIKGQRRG